MIFWVRVMFKYPVALCMSPGSRDWFGGKDGGKEFVPSILPQIYLEINSLICVFDDMVL